MYPIARKTNICGYSLAKPHRSSIHSLRPSWKSSLTIGCLLGHYMPRCHYSIHNYTFILYIYYI